MDIRNLFDREVADNAINKGIEYILSLIENNRWRGFPTLAGESDIWVTGFVLAHIYHLCEQKDVIKESQKFLLASQHPSGGWSYSQQVPPDADSTAWCLMALKSSNEFTGVALREAKVFLWSHFTNGGLSTYKMESGIREFISAPNLETIAGWTSPHADVSIAAVLADMQNERVPEILSWLSGMQTNGFINSYWWRSPFYTTALFLRALTRLKLRLPPEEAKKIAEAFVAEQLAKEGFVPGSSENINPFTTALALESFINLSYLDLHQQITNCANALLLSQNKNGGWAGNFILRIPAPFVTDPNEVASWNNADGGGNSFIEDKDGIFATAMACHALDCWRKIENQVQSLEEWPVFKLKNIENDIEDPN